MLKNADGWQLMYRQTGWIGTGRQHLHFLSQLHWRRLAKFEGVRAGRKWCWDVGTGVKRCPLKRSFQWRVSQRCSCMRSAVAFYTVYFRFCLSSAPRALAQFSKVMGRFIFSFLNDWHCPNCPRWPRLGIFWHNCRFSWCAYEKIKRKDLGLGWDFENTAQLRSFCM